MAEFIRHGKQIKPTGPRGSPLEGIIEELACEHIGDGTGLNVKLTIKITYHDIKMASDIGYIKKGTHIEIIPFRPRSIQGEAS